MPTKKKRAAASKPKKRKAYDWQNALAELGWARRPSNSRGAGSPTWVSPSGQALAFLNDAGQVVSTVLNAIPKIGIGGVWSHPPNRDLIYHLEQLEEHFTTRQDHTVFVEVGVQSRLTVPMRQQLILTVDCIGAAQARDVVEKALQDLIDGRYKLENPQ
jgi:hypothetical protein